MAEQRIPLTTDPADDLRLALYEEEGRLAVELSGGQSARLLDERASLTVRPADLAPDEAELLAPYLAAHPKAGIVRYRRDGFNGYELSAGEENPFRFYTSALIAHLESGATCGGLRLVAVTALPGDPVGPIATVKTLFHLVERA